MRVGDAWLRDAAAVFDLATAGRLEGRQRRSVHTLIVDLAKPQTHADPAGGQTAGGTSGARAREVPSSALAGRGVTRGSAWGVLDTGRTSSCAATGGTATDILDIGRTCSCGAATGGRASGVSSIGRAVSCGIATGGGATGGRAMGDTATGGSAIVPWSVRINRQPPSCTLQ